MSGLPTHDRIARAPTVMVGKPVINGTRITVELGLREISTGMSLEAIADACPRLTLDDVRAALT